MRKTAPVLLFTTLFALTSGSALAMGDRAKEKKANAQTTSQPSSTNAPGSAPSPYSPGSKATTDGSAASPPAQTSSTPSASTSSAPSTSMATADGASATKNKESRCDETKYGSKSAMPADCLDKTSPGAGAAGGASSAGSSK